MQAISAIKLGLNLLRENVSNSVTLVIVVIQINVRLHVVKQPV